MQRNGINMGSTWDQQISTRTIINFSIDFSVHRWPVCLATSPTAVDAASPANSLDGKDHGDIGPRAAPKTTNKKHDGSPNTKQI